MRDTFCFVKQFVKCIARNDWKNCANAIGAGFDINVKTKHGEPLLHVAVRRGSIKICKLLLNSGAKVNATNDHYETALILAASKANAKICKLLMAFKASIAAISKDGRTALMEAARMKSFEVAEIVKPNFFTDMENTADKDGNTVLHHAVPCSNKLLELLVCTDVDINAVNNKGWTALTLAFMSSNGGNVLILAEAEAEFEVNGVSSWDFATEEIVEYLARHQIYEITTIFDPFLYFYDSDVGFDTNDDDTEAEDGDKN